MQAYPLSIGNAIRFLLDYPAGAKSVRLYRSVEEVDVEELDEAFHVYAGGETYVVDTRVPDNSKTYHYAAVFDDPGATVERLEVKPIVAYWGVGEDAQELVRDRLFLGLQNEVAAGRLRNPTGKGAIAVYTAPPPLDTGNFPCVSVHLDSDQPVERALGEDLIGDAFPMVDSNGVISRVDMTVVAWSLNADERIALRKAMKRLIVGNFPVFSAAGLSLVQYEQQDDEDFQSYSAPIYMARSKFSCLVAFAVVSEEQPIQSVEVYPESIW
jgi:hypothetical protein